MSLAGSCTCRFGVTSGSVIRDPLDGVSGAHCPCECFGLVLFWGGGVFELVVGFGFCFLLVCFFYLIFNCSEFSLLLRVLELGDASG